MKSDEMGFTCCICRKHIVGESGNNPWPLRNMSEECCNDCRAHAIEIYYNCYYLSGHHSL